MVADEHERRRVAHDRARASLPSGQPGGQLVEAFESPGRAQGPRGPLAYR
jgi:hypothetical protein